MISTDLVDGDNLAGRPLDLAELAQEVPEAALGDGLVDGEDAHTVQLRRGVGLGRQVTADDLVLREAHCGCRRYKEVGRRL